MAAIQYSFQRHEKKFLLTPEQYRAILPLLADKFSKVSIGIGGTSVIIVVGVALETVKALENQMLMRQYKGFLE